MRALLALGLVGCVAAPADDPEGPTLDDNLGVVEDEGDDVCDNLDGDGHCLLAFPSDHWRADGRLAIPSEATPDNAAGVRLATEGFDADGFGVASPVMFQLAGATLAGLPPVFDAAASLDPGARTVLVDAATGARIPHWVEHDWMDAGPERIFVIRPAVPLPDGARLVVGVRGLVDAAGAVVDAPAGFAALRDRTASTRLGVHARRARYEAEVFPVLEAAGFARDELQLAWDFTTRTDAAAERDLTEVVTAVTAALGDDPPAVTSVTEVASDHPDIAVILDVVIEVPSVLGAPDELGVRRLRRGSDGRVVVEGVESVELRVQVPNAALEGDDPAPVLQYGHGFLGGRGEANNGWLREMAERHRFLIAAIDMQGMSGRNTEVWASVLLGSAGRMGELSEEPMQGLANHLAVQHLFAAGWGDTIPAQLLRDDDTPVWDPEALWYHGNSQGGTMGTLVVATSPYLRRGVLGVPGCAFPLLLQRSSVFVAWQGLLSVAYADPGELTLILGLLGTGWDRVEGLTWADRLADPLPGHPAHEVLLHVALEDSQVQNDVSWLLARAVGAVQPEVHARPVWGVPTAALPAAGVGAAVVNWDFGVAPDATPEDPPVGATDTHGWSRRTPAAQEQAVRFLATGELVDTCAGEPCLVPPF